ncbi:MAG: arginine--tRNA ligase [Gammaproteobacteria bacterium]|nr:arginine--tRNA ligase [Gammaproteobacteria bacterium]
MNLINKIKKEILNSFYELFLAKQVLSERVLDRVQINLNLDKSKKGFGDLSCNASMIFAKDLKQNPREIAQKFIEEFEAGKILSDIKHFISDIQIAGPGFLNFTFTPDAWQQIAEELFLEKDKFFKLDKDKKRLKYLIEFVSANPTGPLHLGHGRGGVIGDVLSNVLNFLGHDAKEEFYVNDAGSQMQKLANSFKIRCIQELGDKIELPEDGYQGKYLIDLAKILIKENDSLTLSDLKEKEDSFFQDYAKEHMLKSQKKDLSDYGIEFDNWFSEKTLHELGQVEKALKILQDKDLVYKKDGALWFRATKFGDDKDRVVKKSTGELTYIAADIAYHKNKFDRGFDKLINILGQDHHGYVKRLKATVGAMGLKSENLDVILYQLVSIKNAGQAVRMSKRAGKFTSLREIIDIVGKDVARFFYLNRKAEAHLDFDLSVALKKTEENPVFYIQYAYVRTRGILEKALEVEDLKKITKEILDDNLSKTTVEEIIKNLGPAEFEIIKKLISLQDILFLIANSYQTHLLSYYMFELANFFHSYYANNRIIDSKNIELSKARLFLLSLVRFTLGLGLDLLELSKPERM